MASRSLFFVPLALWLVACADQAPEGANGDQADSSGEAFGEGATLTFTGDHQQQVSGSLLSGSQAQVVYDPARLTTCRGSKYGYPAWAITGYYRIGEGPTMSFTAVRPQQDGTIVNTATIDLYAAGELQMWFQNTSAFGCQGWDSAYGQNYRFAVKLPASAPGWLGNEAFVISRDTCDGGACDGDRRPLGDVFRFDTWARERAAVAGVYFEVWKEGVTDFANPDLWRKLDVQVYYRFTGQPEFSKKYVNFDRYTGNNARYALSLRDIDPLAGPAPTHIDQCPKAQLSVSPDGQYARAEVDYYFRVNGVELRPSSSQTYRGAFENYRDAFQVCLVPL